MSLHRASSITLSKRGGRCFLRRLCRLRSLEAVLCSVALLNLQRQENPSSVRYYIHTHHTEMRHFSLKTLAHLLMVSSSSESQKLVVSSSLLIIVLELSYPARWRSSRLWPFMRGPVTPQTSAKGHMLVQAQVFFCWVKIPDSNMLWLYQHLYIVWKVEAFSHHAAPCSLCVEVSLSWRKLQTLFQFVRPGSPHCL